MMVESAHPRFEKKADAATKVIKLIANSTLCPVI